MGDRPRALSDERGTWRTKVDDAAASFGVGPKSWMRKAGRTRAGQKSGSSEHAPLGKELRRAAIDRSGGEANQLPASPIRQTSLECETRRCYGRVEIWGRGATPATVACAICSAGR